MASVIFKSVLKPKKVFFIASYLLILEFLGMIVLTVLMKEPLATLISVGLVHLYCINLSNKEPHINNILRNYYWRLSELAGLKITEVPSFCTPVIYADNAEYYYEL